MKRRSAPLYGPYGSGRNLLYFTFFYVSLVNCVRSVCALIVCLCLTLWGIEHSLIVSPSLSCATYNGPIDHYCLYIKKVHSFSWEPIAELPSVTCHRDHTVLRNTYDSMDSSQVNTFCLCNLTIMYKPKTEKT